MRKFMESWGGALAFGGAVAGGAWWIATSIGEVRMELAAGIGEVRTEVGEVRNEILALEARMERRLSTVEAKLDLLIEGLDVRIGDDE